ncbi:hypothetical protein ABT354_11970 [Streptomyces sp. NPDC000594]|uniref:hypothetical protein n=1 Tax=Streptomyces sp. NPDC000594 TaxID=3154261 RepID=UPI003332B645
MAEALVFVRHVDGLRYDFVRDGERHGRAAYRRADGAVWCLWSPAEGWHCEIAGGLVTAYPLAGHADDADPPLGVWRSFKGDRAYLYDLRAVGG